MQASDDDQDRQLRFALAKNRLQILHRIERGLDVPMAVLGAAWLALMVIDLVRGLGSTGTTLVNLIWVIFILDFLLRFALAPRKLVYLRRNWLTVIALTLPALRIFRFARAFRSLAQLRGLRLVRILGSLNRGMKALGKTMRRRGFGYVMTLTAMVTLGGAAGMLSFERGVPGGSLDDYWTALWWTAMIMATMGSEYWPKTPEGRALCLFLSIYAFAVFGYVTGTIATFFIGRDEEEEGTHAAIDALRTEVERLREEVAQRTGKQ